MLRKGDHRSSIRRARQKIITLTQKNLAGNHPPFFIYRQSLFLASAPRGARDLIRLQHIFEIKLFFKVDGNIFLFENTVERIGLHFLLEPIRRQLIVGINPRGFEIIILFRKNVSGFNAVGIDNRKLFFGCTLESQRAVADIKDNIRALHRRLRR